MNFVVQLGFAAAAAGIGWMAKVAVDDSSKNWQGKIEIYDYIEHKPKSVYNLLRNDNGRIISLQIMHKDASGSVNSIFASVIPVYHLVLVLKTNKSEYWSIEKNEKGIHVQRSDKRDDITKWFHAVSRDTPIVYDERRQNLYLTVWGIDNQSYQSIIRKGVNINDVLTFLLKKELSIKFSYLENCQSFIKRILTFMHEEIINITTFYHHSLDRLITEWSDIMNCCADDTKIADIKWLYKQESLGEMNYLVGFLIKTNKKGYWSFESDFDHINIQLSSNEQYLMKTMNGLNRYVELTTANEGRNNSIDLPIVGIPLRNILQWFQQGKGNTTDISKFIYDQFNFVYKTCSKITAKITFHDYSNRSYTDIISVTINTPYNATVVSIDLLSKVTKNRNDDYEPQFEDLIVMIIKTCDGQYWSIERTNGVTHVQMADNHIRLLKRSDCSLKYLPRSDLNVKKIKMVGLLEFVIEHHRKYSDNRQIIRDTLKYFELFDNCLL